MVTLDEVGLFTDGRYAVEPVGVGYSVKNVRDGHIESKIFQTTKACEVEILKRQTTKAA